MPSPFPGMNPYLEHPNIWHDFHGAFISELRVVLVEKLRPRYFVDVDENVYIHELSAEERRFLGRPDIGISSERSQLQKHAGGTTVFADAPLQIEHDLAVDELHESFIRIKDARTNVVVTIIELLSHSNKGSDRDQYLSKRNTILKSTANLVELDFLRAGKRMPDVQKIGSYHYCVLISQVTSRPKAGVWPLQIRDALPVVTVPLLADEGIRIDLQAVLQTVYERHGFDYRIYIDPITPPLPPADAEWAADLLKRAGISAAA